MFSLGQKELSFLKKKGLHAEVAEWSNALAWKARVARLREFESRPLRFFYFYVIRIKIKPPKT